jgi:hypothetical protein
MPTGGIPKVVLNEVRYRGKYLLFFIISTLNNLTCTHMLGYWEKSHTLWGNTDTWDRYFHKNVQDATRQMSHNDLSADLQILIQKLKSGTGASKKALAMQRNLVSIFSQNYHVLRPVLLVWGRRAFSLMYTTTCT